MKRSALLRKNASRFLRGDRLSARLARCLIHQDLLAARFFPRCLGRAVFAELFHHALCRARIRQKLPLLIRFLPGAFLRFLGRGAIIERFTDEGAELRVQPFGAFLPQHLFGGAKGLLCSGLGSQFFGQGAPLRLGFQAAEFLQRD